MKEQPKRVSQDDLADMLASAISVEHQRIEQIGAESVDHVGGGNDWLKIILVPDTTAGYFPAPGGDDRYGA